MTEISASEFYIKEQKESYGNRARHLASEMRARIRSVLFGPQYIIKTKNGQQLTMDTYHIASGLHRRVDVIVATTDSGDLAGHKLQVVDENSDEIEVTNGAIYVARRGEGIAKPLEMVSFHLLQNEAETKRKPITYQGENRNSDHLCRVVDSKGDVNLIKDLTTESERWHSLFGPYGSLGFDPLLRKKFIPNGADLVVNDSDVVHLDMKESIVNERKITVPHVISIESDSIKDQNFRADHLQSLLLKLEGRSSK